MAFTANQVQGISGAFKPVVDYANGALTPNNVQGISGEFKPVLDIAQQQAGTIVKDVIMQGVIVFPR